MTTKKILCPKCKNEVIIGSEFMPFCSKRCRLIDLGAWASEKYSIPAQNQDPSEDDNEANALGESDKD